MIKSSIPFKSEIAYAIAEHYDIPSTQALEQKIQLSNDGLFSVAFEAGSDNGFYEIQGEASNKEISIFREEITYQSMKTLKISDEN